MVWWSSSSGRIELNITKAQASQGSHSGSCDSDIEDLRTVPTIRRQLDKIDPDLLAKELAEYTDWDTTEHDANLNRILWIACGDILEGRG